MLYCADGGPDRVLTEDELKAAFLRGLKAMEQAHGKPRKVLALPLTSPASIAVPVR
ncbi:hypothetical protein MASR2M48_15160 [Spirochaetota bacterium]